MTGTDPSNGENTESVLELQLTDDLLADIDAIWQAQGYEDRTEFIHDVLRDAVKHSDLTRESWKEIAAVEYARRTGESESFDRDEVLNEK
jgi:metal-responsive CopG/Arc/MetJ family transcriptional regulator